MKKILPIFIFLLFLNSYASSDNGEIGTVDSVNKSKREVTIRINSGKHVAMGELLEIGTADGVITLSVKYPMMTVAICRIQGKGNLTSIQINMPVYHFGKSGIKTEPLETGSRFTDTGQGIITDNSTGLIWLKDANPTRGSIPWEKAREFVEKLDAAGFSDWRLPTKEEFDQFLKTDPEEITRTFDNVKYFYWSSSVYPLEPGLIWTADIDNRTTSYTFRTNDNYVWPVRDGKKTVRRYVEAVKIDADDPVRTAAERICVRRNEKFVSYITRVDAMTISEYEVLCKKGSKETKYILKYEKLLGNWSE